LDDFVRDRNIFVHNLFKVPGFNVNTSEGAAAGIDFVISVTDRAVHIRNVLMALSNIVMGQSIIKDKVFGPSPTDAELYELLAIGTFLQSHLDDDVP
jgi:hypothetical protein